MLIQADDLNTHGLPGFDFFDRCATFLEKNTVSTIWAPHVDVDLNFLFAPCTFV